MLRQSGGIAVARDEKTFILWANSPNAWQPRNCIGRTRRVLPLSGFFFAPMLLGNGNEPDTQAVIGPDTVFGAGDRNRQGWACSRFSKWRTSAVST
jgi:hypothetical protein